jgi:hypothetical protein
MKTVNEKLWQWVIEKTEAEFRDDVCLLLNHSTLRRLDEDESKVGMGSFVPGTARAGLLARTFIIDGIGYDLYPQTWERLETMADVNHYNLTCLDDTTVIWARSNVDRQRFESLQAKLRANLKNPQLMFERARNWVNTAEDIFSDMIFEEKSYLIRQNAGYICDLLAVAVAYTNGTFLHSGQNRQLGEIRKLKNVPGDFIEVYEKAILEHDTDEQKKYCRRLICVTRDYLKSIAPDKQQRKRRAAEIAGWYHELSYTWRRVYHCCGIGDAATAFLWACMLQKELVDVAEEYNAPELDILSNFDAQNLNAFAARAAEAEQAIIKIITADGGTLDIYATVDEFLEKNKLTEQ